MNESCSYTGLETKLIYANDLVYILEDVVGKMRYQISQLQPVTDRARRIQLTGKIIWIVDRFVDIDFEALKNIPYIEDGDQLLVLADETHDDTSSIYRIYNTDSVPNVKYVGYAEPDRYPTVTAVEQYVNYITSTIYGDLEKKIKEANSIISSIQQTVDDLKAKVEKLESSE